MAWNHMSVDEVTCFKKWMLKSRPKNLLWNKWARQPVGVHWSEPKTNERKPWWELGWIHTQHIPILENAWQFRMHQAEMKKNHLSLTSSKDHPYKVQRLSNEQLSPQNFSHISTHKKNVKNLMGRKKISTHIHNLCL